MNCHVKSFARTAFISALLISVIIACNGCRERLKPDISPAPGESIPHEDESLRFLLFSDTQADPETGDYTGLRELFAAAVRPHENVELILFGGDSVNDGGSEAEWSDFRQAAGSLFDGLTTASAVGNHDNYPLLAEQFDYPQAVPSERGAGYFYTFSAGPVFFIVLDSNAMGAADQADIDWLRNELQGGDALHANWRVAVMHHPMWPMSDVPRDIQRAQTMREFFLPILEENDVDLILCGHQHVYARTPPMSGETAAVDGRGIVQIMAASGDKTSYSLGGHDYIAASAPAPCYLSLLVTSDHMTITALNAENEELDRVIIDKTASGITGTPAPGLSGGAVAAGDDWRIRVTDSEGNELWSFTCAEISMLPQAQAGSGTHIYSSINNWPSSRFYVADGYSVIDILEAAGVYDTAQTVTFLADDGYEVSMTREQLFSQRYYYPHVGEDGSGAIETPPLIAYRWREGTENINEIRDDRPLFIFGQQTPFEHTNPAFVVGVAEIIVSFEQCEVWPPATTFPSPGELGQGETVKLQHTFYGLVKLHYTLDGSIPTTASPLYNISTYQTELNSPIPVTEPVTIRVLATGYGRRDSEIATFEFWPAA